MTYFKRRILLSRYLFLFPLIFLLLGCPFSQDQNLKLGKYWLEQGNWQRAVEYFQKSLDANPKNWETHLLMLEALAMSGDVKLLEEQLHSTLAIFPDSVQSQRISTVVSTVLGDDVYMRISGEYHKRKVIKKPLD
ncbi:MAG: tetratricopeptide repeat protein [bacterium]